MGLILTVTAGLVVWIVLWALGAKGIDAFLLATAIILVGRLAEDPLRLPARSSQLAPGARALAGPGSLSPPCSLGVVRLRRRGGLRRGRNDRQPADDLLEPAPAGALAPISQQIVNGEKLALRTRRARGAVQGRLRVARRREPDERAVEPRHHRDERQDGRPGHEHDRLSWRLRLGRHRGLAAADQRRRHPAGQPGQPLRGPHLLVDAGQDEPERFYPSGKRTFAACSRATPRRRRRR